ncbi:MAG: GNAT family N-acetyltransferase [Pseudomonadota bacterium]|nr:GNAT family N-acetyltransferase [Pseudomonadota bacterium]
MIFAASSRLILRRAVEADLEPLVESWSDPDMTRYTNAKPDARAFLVQMIADMQVKQPGEMEPGGPWYQFIAERREDGALLGDLGAGFGIPGERQVELGFRILPRYQRQGYAREAVAALIDYLIAAYGIHRFVGVAASRNRASCALLSSLGFRQEGHFRQSFACRGEWLDDEHYALLASEWRSPSG